jgi:hypothetical protein
MSDHPTHIISPKVPNDYVSEFVDFATNVVYGFQCKHDKPPHRHDSLDMFGHSLASAIYVADHLEEMKAKFPYETLEEILRRCFNLYRESHFLPLRPKVHSITDPTP